MFLAAISIAGTRHSVSVRLDSILRSLPRPILAVGADEVRKPVQRKELGRVTAIN